MVYLWAMAVVDAVLVAHNQALLVGELVRGLRRHGARAVVVVDSGSADDTAHEAEQAGAVVLRQRRAAEGAAVQLAVAHLSSLPAPPDVVAFFAADGSDDPALLPALVRPLADRHFDLALGSRVLGEGSVPLSESASRLVAVNLIHAIYGHRYSDVATVMAVRLPALVALGLADQTSGVWGELLVKAVRRGLRVAEVPARERSAPRRAWRRLSRGGRTILHALRHAVLR